MRRCGIDLYFDQPHEIYFHFFFLMIRRPPRSTLDRSSAASDVYKRQGIQHSNNLFSLYKHNSALLKKAGDFVKAGDVVAICLLYTSPSPRDRTRSRMPSSA